LQKRPIILSILLTKATPIRDESGVCHPLRPVNKLGHGIATQETKKERKKRGATWHRAGCYVPWQFERLDCWYLSPPWYRDATIPDLLCVLQRLGLFFPKNMMMTYQQFPRLRYVSQVSVISFVEWAGSSRSLPTKELIPPPTAISGMWGRRGVVEEASCMGRT